MPGGGVVWSYPYIRRSVKPKLDVAEADFGFTPFGPKLRVPGLHRYVAFLDILGFSDLVRREPLAQVKHRLGLALHSVQIARDSAVLPDGVGVRIEKRFHFFSFSDTFVIASADDSPEALLSFITGAAILTQYLFVQRLPVRGAITFGEADFIPGSNGHLVGKAIIAAHELERRQEWLGVTVDVPSLPPGIAGIFESGFIAPLYARWNVPVKPGKDCEKPIIENALVVNWRWNLIVEHGTKSLFAPTDDPRALAKIENTLVFAKHIRATNRHAGHVKDKNGKVVDFRFLRGCAVGSKPPNQGLVHGDEL